jgi:hypothetical protein
MHGKQCISQSLLTLMMSYLESCRKSGVNLSTYQSLMSLTMNCTSPLKWCVLVNSGISTLV